MGNIGRKTVKAFTLIETLISILFISLAIVITSYVFQTINQWFWNYNEGQDFKVEFTSLYCHLKMDIQNAEVVSVDNHKVIIQYYNAEKNCTYEFKKHLVVLRKGKSTSSYVLNIKLEIDAGSIFLIKNNEKIGCLKLPKNQL